jgi:hypothetical protein
MYKLVFKNCQPKVPNDGFQKREEEKKNTSIEFFPFWPAINRYKINKIKPQRFLLTLASLGRKKPSLWGLNPLQNLPLKVPLLK